jgi:hypothetical protein
VKHPDANKVSLPISVYQHRYFAKWAKFPHGTAFNTSMVVEISGKLNTRALKQACYRAAQKHEILHATYSEDGSEQRYTEFAIADFFLEQDVSADADPEKLIRGILDQTFDLKSGPAFTFHLLRRGPRTHYLISRSHHIISDAASTRVLIKDLIIGYALALVGLSGVAIGRYSYARCIQALRASQTAEKQEAAKQFWKAFLTGIPLTVAFPVKAGAVDGDHTAESIYFDLSERTSDALKRFARDNGTTLFLVLSALYGFLLSRYANQPEVLVSYPVNMRPKGYSHVVGCFVNLVLQKTVVGPGTTFKSLVEQLTRQRNEVKPHQFYCLSEIINEQGDLKADIERSCFSVFFGATFLSNKRLPVPLIKVQPLDIPWTQEFDRELRLLYDATGLEYIKCRMDFQSKKFDKHVILQFIEDFKSLADRVIRSDAPLDDIEVSVAYRGPGRLGRPAAT